MIATSSEDAGAPRYWDGIGAVIFPGSALCRVLFVSVWCRTCSLKPEERSLDNATYLCFHVSSQMGQDFLAEQFDCVHHRAMGYSGEIESNLKMSDSCIPMFEAAADTIFRVANNESVFSQIL